MSDSAFLALREEGVALVTPVDIPPARQETLHLLKNTVGNAIPTWNGIPGHPVRLVPPHVHERLDVRLAAARHVPVDDPDCVQNLNRPEEWAAWLTARAGGRLPPGARVVGPSTPRSRAGTPRK